MRETVFGYLISYGYGPRAGLFGQGGPLQRLEFRYDRISGDVGRGLTTTAVLVALVGIAAIGWRWWRDHTPPENGRPILAVFATVALGMAALISTSNNGVWFELPLIVLLVPLVGSMAAKAALPFRLVLLGQIATQAVVVLAVLWWVVPPRWGITAHYEDGFAQYDERFASDRRDELTEAAEDWRRVNGLVAEELRELDGEEGLGAVFTTTGNMQLLNTNTIALASELGGWGPRQEVPDTTAETDRLDEYLTPTATGSDGRIVERMLVVALHDQHLFTPDAEVGDFYRRALSEGLARRHHDRDARWWRGRRPATRRGVTTRRARSDSPERETLPSDVQRVDPEHAESHRAHDGDGQRLRTSVQPLGAQASEREQEQESPAHGTDLGHGEESHDRYRDREECVGDPVAPPHPPGTGEPAVEQPGLDPPVQEPGPGCVLEDPSAPEPGGQPQ